MPFHFVANTFLQPISFRHQATGPRWWLTRAVLLALNIFRRTNASYVAIATGLTNTCSRIISYRFGLCLKRFTTGAVEITVRKEMQFRSNYPNKLVILLFIQAIRLRSPRWFVSTRRGWKLWRLCNSRRRSQSRVKTPHLHWSEGRVTMRQASQE